MTNDNSALLADVANYYTAKLSEFGTTPRGVDWNGEKSQILRFEQLCSVISPDTAFSINDLGCGYGAMFEHLSARFDRFEYTGWDVSSEMISAAESRFCERPNAHFRIGSLPVETADFGVASGIFNVRLEHSDDHWRAYLISTLDALHETSIAGFAFNCLTSYSDQDKKRNHLYYADPCELFDHCKRRYARHVALLHDYGLYEFTIIVRKLP